MERRGRLAASSTQTDTSEFLDLRSLQLASSQQQDQLVHLRSELQNALAQSAAAISQSTANTAAERDEHYRSVVRHLERTHKQALEHERAAHSATLNNELTKQRAIIERRIRDELHASTEKREAQLQAALKELEMVRRDVGRRDEELASLQSAASRDRAAFEAERERVQELELEVVRQDKVHEEERNKREQNGFYVEAEQLHELEAKLIEVQGKLDQSVERHEETKAALEAALAARAALEQELEASREQLSSAKAEIDGLVEEKAGDAAKNDDVVAQKAEESAVAIAEVKEEAQKQADLCNLIVARQASALKKLADENADLLRAFAGMPALKRAFLANSPAPGARPGLADPELTPKKLSVGEPCPLCGVLYHGKGGPPPPPPPPPAAAAAPRVPGGGADLQQTSAPYAISDHDSPRSGREGGTYGAALAAAPLADFGPAAAPFGGGGGGELATARGDGAEQGRAAGGASTVDPRSRNDTAKAGRSRVGGARVRGQPSKPTSPHEHYSAEETSGTAATGGGSAPTAAGLKAGSQSARGPAAHQPPLRAQQQTQQQQQPYSARAAAPSMVPQPPPMPREAPAPPPNSRPSSRNSAIAAASNPQAYAPVAAPAATLALGGPSPRVSPRVGEHYVAAPEAGGAAPYGKRQKPGQKRVVAPPAMPPPLHSGVDELGSTAWRSQPRP